MTGPFFATRPPAWEEFEIDQIERSHEVVSDPSCAVGHQSREYLQPAPPTFGRTLDHLLSLDGDHRPSQRRKHHPPLDGHFRSSMIRELGEA